MHPKQKTVKAGVSLVIGVAGNHGGRSPLRQRKRRLEVGGAQSQSMEQGRGVGGFQVQQEASGAQERNGHLYL